VLELGGNDAAIILPDVTPKDIAREIYDEAFGSCGQVCIAIKRLYVHESIFDEMVEELRRISEKTSVGNGMEKETDMGPINNLPQLERVTELVEDARQHGAKIITGGKRIPRPG
jgi:acyl-CoA reductase-like NAD-dependent aldehyde dehydrogenase